MEGGTEGDAAGGAEGAHSAAWTLATLNAAHATTAHATTVHETAA
jgi:hypothetical protein